MALGKRQRSVACLDVGPCREMLLSFPGQGRALLGRGFSAWWMLRVLPCSCAMPQADTGAGLHRDIVLAVTRPCVPCRYDDYDYAEVNQLLERMLKVYIKTVTCYPEKTNSEMFDRFWKQFKHSEKVGQLASGSDQLWWSPEWAGGCRLRCFRGRMGNLSVTKPV